MNGLDRSALKFSGQFPKKEQFRKEDMHESLPSYNIGGTSDLLLLNLIA